MSAAAKLRQIALEQPDAEVETWGHPTFRVGGHVFSVSPRVGKSGWVTVVLAEVHADKLRDLVADAWRRTSQSD